MWNGTLAVATAAAFAPIEATALKATAEDRREIIDNFIVESYSIGIVVVVAIGDSGGGGFCGRLV